MYRVGTASKRLRCGAVEDYTNKYKGEQVELALFGGEYQEGVLTAYCSIEDVPHVELNGHILVPLQNVASLHCSSRCDAPEPDWPPRGLEADERRPRRRRVVRRRVTANLLKAFLLVGFLVALAAGVGWLIGGERSAALFAFCALSAAIAVYWLGDRALLGMLGARPFALAEDPLLRSATDRVAAQLGIPPPKLALIDDGFPRAFVVGRGPGQLHARGLARVCSAPSAARSSRPSSHTSSPTCAASTCSRRRSPCCSRRRSSRRAGSAASSRARSCSSSAPIAAAFTHALLSPKREFAADRDAAGVCDPHDLADALLRLDRAGELVSFAASPTTEPLYAVDPFEHDRLSRMFRTHPPLAERVRRLRAMDAGTRTPARRATRVRRPS